MRGRYIAGAVTALTLALLVACASNTTTQVVSCTVDTDCASDQRCQDAVCVPGVGADAAGDIPRPDDARRDDTGDSTPWDTDGDALEPGDILLEPCREQADCPGGYCIGSPLGDRCTRGCTTDADCAAAPGWRCTPVRTPGFDLERICYPATTDLCEPCLVDTDCGGLTDRCIALSEGNRHCGLDCGLSELCPPGFYCALQNNGSRQCAPVNDDCGPCLTANLLEDVEHCGACYRACTLENATSRCEQGTCLIDTCDEGMFSCDETDATGCETDLRSDEENCGSCGTRCRGGEVCDGGRCICPAGWLSCASDCRPPNACGTCEEVGDRAPGDACGLCDTGRWACGAQGLLSCVDETDLNSDVSHCGACFEACGPLEICVSGLCACDAGAIPCGGGCALPNACGGCASLDGDPASACGLCGSGAWVCSGEDAVRCEGETELRDDAHCGTCDNTCTGGTSCDEGACRCPLGQVLCEGVCQADNGCGGCSPLSGVPSTPCGLCDAGRWTCLSEEAVQCANQPNLLTSDLHCGLCGNACVGGTFCEEGACRCPVGQVLCDGTCRLPNACGGCASLAPAAGASCGYCGTGTAICAGAEATSCQGATSALTDTNNCGFCENVCTGGQVCSSGLCACPGDQILCGGVCQAPNACGGCAALQGSIGEACGTCGSGTWQCSGTGAARNTTCQGQISLENNDDNCGSCGNRCTGGTSCVGTSCVCPLGQILCGGVCQAPNACGGCSTLSNGVNEACGTCGLDRYVCSGTEATVCSNGGQTTNPCGGCSTLSNYGSACGTCSNGTFLCNGANATSCQGATTNACGGCTNLSRTLGSTCQTCGTWQCSGTEWVCSTPNFQTDRNNCGGCGVTCGADQACSAGSCVCDTGRPYNRVWIRSQSVMYTNWQTALEASGYVVSRSGSAVSTTTLANNDVIVFDTSSHFGTATPADLLAFVQSGGSVILLGGSGGSTTWCPDINPYASPLGFRFSRVSNDTSSCSGGDFDSNTNQTTSSSSHPITSGMTTSNYRQRTGYEVRNVSGTSDIVRLSSGSLPVVRVRQVGCGRVVAISDGGGARDNGTTENWSSVRPFWLRVVDWAAFRL